jgi:hypothetical protein
MLLAAQGFGGPFWSKSPGEGRLSAFFPQEKAAATCDTFSWIGQNSARRFTPRLREASTGFFFHVLFLPFFSSEF